MNTSVLAMLMLVPIFLFALAFVLRRRAAERNERLPAGTPLSMQWFKFYTYVRIPLGILYVLFVTPPLVAQALSRPAAVAIVAITTVYVALLLFLFLGLHRRRLWGWRLNWFVLAIETLLLLLLSVQAAADLTSVITMFLVGLALWFWPNAAYFRERRDVFT